MSVKTVTSKVMLTGVGMIFFQLGNFLLAILIARYSGAESMGSFQFFVVTTTVFAYFGRLGFDERLVYILPKISGGAASDRGQGEISHALYSTMKASMLAAVAVVIFYIGLDHFSQQKAYVVESLYALFFVPFFSCGLVAISVFRAEQKIMLRSILTYFFPVILGLSSYFLIFNVNYLSQDAAIIARVISYGLVFILALYLLNKEYQLGFFSKVLKARSWKTSTSNYTNYDWLIISVITFLIESGALLIWAIKASLSLETLGIFVVLLRLANIVLMVPASIGVVVAPFLAKQQKDCNKSRRGVLLANIVLCVIAALIIASMSHYLLGLFGSVYLEYAESLLPLLIGACVLAITQPLQFMALAKLKIQRVIVTNILALIACFGVLILMDFGDIGEAANVMLYAAVATAAIRVVFLSRE